MTTVNINLLFDGNCREAFEFYKSILGGEFIDVKTFGEIAEEEGMPPAPEDKQDQIAHVSLPVSNETMLMGIDSSKAFGQKATAYSRPSPRAGKRTCLCKKPPRAPTSACLPTALASTR